MERLDIVKERNEKKTSAGEQQEEVEDAVEQLLSDLADAGLSENEDCLSVMELLQSVGSGSGKNNNNAMIEEAMRRHWSLRVLQLELTKGEDGGDSTSAVVMALRAASADGEKLRVSELVEFCLGPLLALFFGRLGVVVSGGASTSTSTSTSSATFFGKENVTSSEKKK